jgi:hypothetical protein
MTQAGMQTRHGSDLSPQSLPPTEIDAYPDAVADSSDIRRLRVDDDTWEAYTEIVGERGRSADLKAYINWRIDNPAEPLPGHRRGPTKKPSPAKTAVMRSSSKPSTHKTD